VLRDGVTYYIFPEALETMSEDRGGDDRQNYWSRLWKPTEPR